MKYPLVKDTIRNSDIDALCEWLKSYPRLSKGPLTPEFEAQWAEWLGAKYAVYVNSGSSANLLVLAALLEGDYIGRGDKIVVPGVSWASDLSPVMQLGFEPVLCDCNLDDLSLDLDAFEKICKEQQPTALMFVSVLGLVPDMERLTALCEKYNVHLIEDTCESFGSQFGGQTLGTFGIAATFSLYYGHHLSTIEGGMITTNDDNLYNILLSMRSHGWMRDCTIEHANKCHKEWGKDSFSQLYTFYYSGYNLRSTDLQAFLGIRQLKYVDEVIKIREENFKHYIEHISDILWKPRVSKQDLISNFCYPLICNNRSELQSILTMHQIETRPLIAGSMAQQPVYIKKYGHVNLSNAKIVHACGLYLPNNHNLKKDEISFIAEVINEHAI